MDTRIPQSRCLLRPFNVPSPTKLLVGLSPTLECSVQGLDEEVDAILFSTLLFTSIGEVSNALSEGGDQRQICSG